MSEPFEYSAEMSSLIAEVKGEKAQFDGSDWSDERLKPVRKALKDYFIDSQGVQCCYCNRHLNSTNNSVWTIDHIIPRSSHPQFSFNPRNLAASCHDCNIAKSDSNVLVGKRKRFPEKSSAYSIVHPHFDKFDDHVKIVSRFIYFPKKGSRKGKQTIVVCDLLRYAEKFGPATSGVSDDRFEIFVDALLDADLEREQMKAILGSLFSRVESSSE